MVFTPNRAKIFEDIDATDFCEQIGCSHFHVPETVKKHDPVCMATMHYECPRVEMVASGINKFIAEHDDVFIYLNEIK